MFIKRITKKIFARLIDTPEEISMQYCRNHGFKHGDNFRYMGGYPIDANWPWLITIGDNVVLSSDVRILAHDASTCYAGVHTKIGRVIIGNNVFIGAGTTVLCNTRIGDNVVVGAGAVVTHDIPSNSVCAGNPAEVICTFDEWTKKHRELFKSRPYFNQRSWDDWKNASQEEWEEMSKQLESGCGYV